MPLIIPVRYLSIALAHVSDDTSRLSLLGVHITPEYIEATNGMSLVRFNGKTGLETGSKSLVLSKEAQKAVHKAAKAKRGETAAHIDRVTTFTPDANNRTWSVSVEGAESLYSAETLDMVFPAADKVIPSEETRVAIEMVSIDGELLARFPRGSVLTFSGQDAKPMRVTHWQWPEMVGALCPMRIKL